MYEPSPVPEVIYGPNYGTWNTYHWHLNIASNGTPITTWADAADHSVTYSAKYPTTFIPGAVYAWATNFMPLALGYHSGSNYSKVGQQFRFELLNESEVVTHSARLNFSIISSSQSGYNPIVHHVKSYGDITAIATWEYDVGVVTPTSGITEFNGVRVYWFPYLTPGDPWYPVYILNLMLAPNVEWCT